MLICNEIGNNILNVFKIQYMQVQKQRVVAFFITNTRLIVECVFNFLKVAKDKDNRLIVLNKQIIHPNKMHNFTSLLSYISD